jgi:branched-chain amino acid transport system substrate-binding protein
VNRRIVISAAISSACVLLAACSSSGNSGGNPNKSSGASGTPVQLMVSAAISGTGTLAANASLTVQSVQAAAKLINAAGGINGHKVNVTVVDDKGDPTTAITKLQDAITSGKKPLAWFDGGPANTASAVLPILTQNKILSFNVAPTTDSGVPTKNPYNFDLSTALASKAAPFCTYAKAQGAKSVAIVYGDDAVGSATGPLIKQDCESDGVTVTGSEGYDPTALDMTAQLQKLQNGHPDTLVLVGYGAPVGYVLKDINKLGWNVPILGDSSVAATSLISTGAPEGLLGTPEVANLKIQVYQCEVYKPAAEQRANLNKIISTIKASGTIDTVITLAESYDGVQLLIAAAKQAGTVTDVAAIAKALETLPSGSAATGIYANYAYSATSHAPTQPESEFAFVTPTKVVDGQFGAP